MMVLLYILSTIGIIGLCLLAVDIVLSLNRWQSRIHIGRWDDRKAWQQALEKKAMKWIRHNPTVKITDESRLILWDMLRGAYHSRIIQSWQDAGLLFALDEEAAKAYVRDHPALFTEEMLEIDSALLAYILKKKNALPADAEQQFKEIITEYAQNKKTIPYRRNLPDIRFVDTIGLICPFLSICGLKDLACRQIEDYDKVLLKGVFPPHAYDTKTEKPMGVFDWSRGLGWYILGITETDSLPGNRERILRLSENLLPLQREDGGFNCMAFNKKERFESSGTALIGLLFVKAYRLSNDLRYLNAALSAEKALMKATRRDGTVDYAQGDTKGIGFYSRTFDRMPFAQGMSLYLSKRIDCYERDLG